MLALLILYELSGTVSVASYINGPDSPSSALQRKTLEERVTPPSEFRQQPFEQFSEIYERPLFWKSREPFTPRAIISESLNYQLAGVFISHKQRWALLRVVNRQHLARKTVGNEYDHVGSDDGYAYSDDDLPIQDGGFLRLQVNEVLDGWVLESITVDRAIFSRDNYVQALNLHTPSP